MLTYSSFKTQPMKPILSLSLCSLFLYGCVSTPAQKNYDDIGDRFFVTFLDNPEAKAGTCNPIIEAALPSDAQAMPLDFTMHVNVKEQRSVNIVMLPSARQGLLIGRAPMFSSKEDSFDGTCKQMHLRISDLECRNATGREIINCPVNKRTDGLRMFGYVAVHY